ncbi:hypothetical protein C8J31_11480 [Rhizobium sp. PP-CC-2G-626]|nr:hypothetical protein C8J31_11480 [Rhizobium sp. PP-CC-2G-626]
MKKKFQEIIKHIKLHLGWYIITAMFILGAGGLIVGRLMLFMLPLGQHSLLGDLLSGGGTAICAGGVSGAVMKILATEGFFLDAVADVMHKREGLERLSEKRLKEVWKDSTRLLHLRSFETDHKSDEVQHIVTKMRSDYEEALEASVPAKELHFVNSHSRVLEFSWHDRDRGILCIRDVTISEIIPFKSKEVLTWKGRVASDTNLNLNNVVMDEVSFKLISEDDAEHPIKSVKSREGNEFVTEFTSAPRERHEVRRERNWKLPILTDPNFKTISPYIVSKADIFVKNNADGIRIIFSSIGKPNLFKPIDGDVATDCGREAHFRARRMLVPDQGYELYLLTVPQKD